MSRPLVVAVILNYCSYRDTIECFECVEASDYPNVKVLVIDNASPDGEGEELVRSLSGCEVVVNDSNLGYAGGNNIGIRFALGISADYVLILNPDVRIRPTAISDWVRLMAERPKVAALNAIQFGSDGRTVDVFFRSIIPRSLCEDFLNPCVNSIECIEVDRLFGAALMMSTNALRRAGGFDPLFFAYGEEVDLCRRFRRRGYRLILTNSNPVVHLRTKENAGISEFSLFLRTKGHYLGRLKSSKSFFGELWSVLRELDLAGRVALSDRYPYSTYKISKDIVISVRRWIVRNSMNIFVTRVLEPLPRRFLWNGWLRI